MHLFVPLDYRYQCNHNFFAKRVAILQGNDCIWYFKTQHISHKSDLNGIEWSVFPRSIW